MKEYKVIIWYCEEIIVKARTKKEALEKSDSLFIEEKSEPFYSHTEVKKLNSNSNDLKGGVN